MANISDVLVQSALTQATGEQAEAGVESMAKLGEHIQNVQLRKQQIEAQKLQIQNAKLDKFVDALDKGRKFTGTAKSNYYKNFLPKLRDGMGLTDMFPDDSLQFAVSTDDNLARLSALTSRVQSGKISAEDAIKIAMDPLLLSEIAPALPAGMFGAEDPEGSIQKFLEAEKTAEGFKAQAARQERQIQAKTEAETTDFERTAERQARKKVADDYTKFASGGGLASAKNKLDKLRAVRDALKSGEIKTRTASTFVPGLASETAQARINPKLKAAMDDVRGAIALKSQLDSQFSQKEAEIAFGRAFDPALPPDENITKIENTIKELETDLATKTKEFQRYGFQTNTKPAGSQNQAILGNIKRVLAKNPNLSDEELVNQLAQKMNRQTAIQLVREARGSK